MTSLQPQSVVVTPDSPGLPAIDANLAVVPPVEPVEVHPSRKGVAGWIVYDLANTLFSQNMISNYFPVWVVGVMGGSDGQISLVNTIGIFMAVYLTVQLGFSSGEKDRLLLLAIVAAVAGGFFWGRVVDRIGPRDSLLRVLVVWSIALALIAATGFTWLPHSWLWGIAPLAGFAMGGTWASDRPLMIGLAPPEYLGQFYGLYALAGRFAALIGPLLWALIVDVLGFGRPVALVVLLGFVMVAMAILRPLSSAIGKAPA